MKPVFWHINKRSVSALWRHLEIVVCWAWYGGPLVKEAHYRRLSDGGHHLFMATCLVQFVVGTIPRKKEKNGH